MMSPATLFREREIRHGRKFRDANRKKRKIGGALDASPMAHFRQVLMQNNGLATESTDSMVTFRAYARRLIENQLSVKLTLDTKAKRC